MEQRKLVLVLDLDNTLLHAELFAVGSTLQPKADNPDQRPRMVQCEAHCPLMKAMRRRQLVETGGFHILDETKSLYHIWEPRLFSHRVKLRPFCAVFLQAAILTALAPCSDSQLTSSRLPAFVRLAEPQGLRPRVHARHVLASPPRAPKAVQSRRSFAS